MRRRGMLEVLNSEGVLLIVIVHVFFLKSPPLALPVKITGFYGSREVHFFLLRIMVRSPTVADRRRQLPAFDRTCNDYDHFLIIDTSCTHAQHKSSLFLLATTS